MISSDDDQATTYATLFRIVEGDDPDHARRLTLIGELEIASSPELDERLRELGAAGRRDRLDLSQLAFTDSTGISMIPPRPSRRGPQRLAAGSRARGGAPGRPPDRQMGLDDQLWPPSAR